MAKVPRGHKTLKGPQKHYKEYVSVHLIRGTFLWAAAVSRWKLDPSSVPSLLFLTLAYSTTAALAPLVFLQLYYSHLPPHHLTLYPSSLALIFVLIACTFSDCSATFLSLRHHLLPFSFYPPPPLSLFSAFCHCRPPPPSRIPLSHLFHTLHLQPALTPALHTTPRLPKKPPTNQPCIPCPCYP